MPKSQSHGQCPCFPAVVYNIHIGVFVSVTYDTISFHLASTQSFLCIWLLFSLAKVCQRKMEQETDACIHVLAEDLEQKWNVHFVFQKWKVCFYCTFDTRQTKW